MTCSTLGFDSSSQVYCSPSPVYGQETVANACVHNWLYPANIAGNEVARSGIVTFSWASPGFGSPEVQLTPVPPDQNPALVVAKDGTALVNYDAYGLAEMKWVVDAQNLGLSSPVCTQVTGQLIARAHTKGLQNPTGEGWMCAPNDPPENGLSPWTEYSTPYTFEACDHAELRQKSTKGRPTVHGHEDRAHAFYSDKVLNFAFIVGCPSQTAGRGHIEVRRLRGDANAGGVGAYVSDPVDDAKLVASGALIQHVDARPLRLKTEQSAGTEFDLAPGQYRQGLVRIELPSVVPVAVELLLVVPRQRTRRLCVAVSPDPCRPIVIA